MKRIAVVLLGVGIIATGIPAHGQVQELTVKLNEDLAKVTEKNKSYHTLFEAYLDVTPAPSATGKAANDFNLRTIHPGMDNWSAVSGWAESNPNLASAILECKEKLIIGLPYGREGLDQSFISAGLTADIAIDGNLRRSEFPYLNAMDTIAAFATAECYRLLAAGESQRAVDLFLAEIFVIDQLCERRFLEEKLHGIHMMTDFLECFRDMMYLYRNAFTIDQIGFTSYTLDGDKKEKRTGVAKELPFVRIDLLQMPDGDRVVAEAVLNSVFDDDGFANLENFVKTFTEMQAEDQPLTRFGAAKRWRMVATIHSSLKASQERLKLVFDDWWRRWDVRSYDPILDIPTQYERANAVRFAAVLYAMRDIDEIFDARRTLVASVNATAMACGLNAYQLQFGKDPSDVEKIYAQFIMKRFDLDPYDVNSGPFGYRYAPDNRPLAISSDYGFIDATGGVLYSKGTDNVSNRGAVHNEEGNGADIIFWPPLRALARQQGLRD